MGREGLASYPGWGWGVGTSIRVCGEWWTSIPSRVGVGSEEWELASHLEWGVGTSISGKNAFIKPSISCMVQFGMRNERAGRLDRF